MSQAPTQWTRREFGGALVAAPLAVVPARSASQAPPGDAVQFGLQTFSFHDLPPAGDPQIVPTIIRNMTEIGLHECEIMSSHVEPWPSFTTGWWVQSRRAPAFAKIREDARRWRLTVPLDHYRNVRQRFDDAGIRIHLYNINFNETFTDEERDRTFAAAAALGVAGFSASTVLSEARRLVPFVARHGLPVAMHNHNNLVDPDQFATPASFEQALAMSDRFQVTLDIGHFVAGNNDPVAFIARHHARIVNIHIRDRKRNNGPSRPWGQGDTPIAEVLRLIRDNRYPIRCYLEYEYGSFRSSTEELKRCLAYYRQALA
jgi:sugar phosphate isomerase/epimerase